MNGGHHPDPLIDGAIDEARRTHPYYAAAIAALRIVADPNVPTMSTSASWVTHFNPATVAGWTPEQRGAVLVHELEHLLRDHHGRCEDRDPRRWNMAGDAEINQRLANLPDGAVLPEQFGMPRGAMAETYYGAVPEQGKPDAGDGDGSGDGAGQPGAGDGSGDGAGQPGAGAGAPGQGAPCGSAAGGPTQDHEAGDAAAPGRGAVDGGKAIKETVEAVLSSGVGVGDDPGTAVREWAEAEIGIDRSQWYAALATVVGRTLAPFGAPTRWQWPGRRDMRDVGGAMLPRWTGERPQCAVIIDTSDSITPGDLDLARAAGHYLGRIADVTYYGCTTYPLLYGSRLPDEIGGGGGTYLDAGIARAIADGARAVIVITDCMTHWQTDGPYAVPVIVGANVGAYTHVFGPGAKYTQYAPPEWVTVLPVVQS